MSVARDKLPTIKAKSNAIKSYLPYPHQEAAIADALQEFEQANRATLIMPCGTGKTLVCLWIAEKIKAKTVVVFVPSLALIHQTALEWAKATSKSLKLMAICSDLTVALDEDGIIVDKDEFWFPVLSVPAEISTFLQEPVNNKEIKVVFCTYQSSFTLAEAMGDFKFMLGVFDEAHKTAVRGESYFSAPLFDEYIVIDKRLFVTATSKQYVLAKKDEQDNFVSVLSMDNEEHYGKHCHVLSFRKAIEQGIISDYKIVFPEVTSDMVAKEMRLRDKVFFTKNDAYNAAMQIALRKAISKTQTTRIITFHSKVVEAEQFAESLRKNNYVPGCHISHVNGKQTSSTRKTIMREFENKTKALITNARCLTEGIDVPSVDMVAILSNKKSKIDLIQAIGRALRKHPGKQCGYIMIPVFVDTAAGETYEEAIARPGSQILFEILLALEQHDELLCEAIRNCKFNEGYVGKRSLLPLDKFFDLNTQKYLASDRFRKALSVAIIDRLGSNWDKMIGGLVKFKTKHGHCSVPMRFKDDPALGRLVGKIRVLNKRGLLSEDKVRELNALGFIWDCNAFIWKQQVSKIIDFKKKHGVYSMPNIKEDPNFFNWITTVRVLRKKGLLSKDKIAELNKINFIWDPYDMKWQSFVTEFVKFKAKQGNGSISNKSSKTYAQLNSQVYNIRVAKRKGVLSKAKIAELNKLGFVWEPLDTAWRQYIAKLIQFKKQNGHCLVQRNSKTDAAFARWVCAQRVLKNKGLLSKDRIIELDDIGFIWDPMGDIWKQHIKMLKKLVAKYGHCDILSLIKKETTFYYWIQTIRKYKKKGTLSKSKIIELNKLGFI